MLNFESVLARTLEQEKDCVRIAGMLVLASTSPRRQQLLSMLGCSFQILSAVVDESRNPDETPAQYVLRLANEKAQAVLLKASPESLVLAADTAVVCGDQILGKPEDARQAVEMLQQLRRGWHQVYTGLVIMNNNIEKKQIKTELCITQVKMRDYDDEDILVYVESGDAYDKAGAYAIQHTGFEPVERLIGCYANVVGLPLCLLTRSLQKFGMQINQICPGIDADGLDDECKVRL
jgi:septum formation protein